MNTNFGMLLRNWAQSLGLVVALVVGVSLSAHAQTTAPSTAATLASASTSVAATTAVAPADSKHADNPYGIGALWMNSDAIARAVLLLLAVMSMGSWYILAVKLLEQRKVSAQTKVAAEKFWSAGVVSQGIETLDEQSPYHFIASSGVDAIKKHEGLLGHVPLSDWIAMSVQRSVDRVNREMQGGLSFLATVGSISPFVGLFGTVWGIYHALTAIGISGQASIDKVAGPVGEALIMTAIGLAVAVPAVLAYNYLVNRNKAVMDDIRSFGSDLHAVLLGTSTAR